MILVTVIGGPQDGRTLVMREMEEIVWRAKESMAFYAPDAESLVACTCRPDCGLAECAFVFVAEVP